MDLKSLLNLNTVALADRIKGIDPLLPEQLKAAATNFAKDSADDIVTLGQDVVDAILHKSLFEFMPIPDLGENADPDEIAAYQAILVDRSRISQLISGAQLHHSEAVERVLNNAKKVASFAYSIVAGGAAKILTGGLA